MQKPDCTGQLVHHHLNNHHCENDFLGHSCTCYTVPARKITSGESIRKYGIYMDRVRG